MTRQGFLNLSESEQNRVFQAALDEFARADFSAASLNQIIQQAGISKGSMYHYFENKEDLYFYVLKRAMIDKAAFLRQSLQNLDRPIEACGFFEKLHIMMHASIRFAQMYPRYQKMNTHLQNMPAGSFKERVWDQFNQGFDDFIKDMVDHAIQSGELRGDLDRSFIIRVMRVFMLRFTDFYSTQEVLIAEKTEIIDHDLNQLILFLKTGLLKSEDSDNNERNNNNG